MNATQCRWGELGRILMRQAASVRHDEGSVGLPTEQRHSPLTSHSTCRRQARLASAAAQATSQSAVANSICSILSLLVHCQTARSAASVRICNFLRVRSKSHMICGKAGEQQPLCQPHRVHVYTDGSYVADSLPHSTSAWAITVADQWLDDNYSGIPSDEHLLQAAHVRGASMFGASISCTRGVYAAELQAIARTLAMFPTSCELEIHSDSQGALAGIRAYEMQLNERRRLRMAARPLLQLIHHLLERRRGWTRT